MTAWDVHRPPDPELIADCVHCGFCLPTCPSYAVFEEEMDTPRGRIVLMRVGHEDGTSDEMRTHFDRCLGCMACVTACPSGVKYDQLIERTRPQVERVAPRPRRERLHRRLIFSLVPILAAYVVAHYFSLLAYQGQDLWRLASDPLGDGSDLFGGAGATIDYGVISATSITYVQIVALVVGHVAALVLAHDRALVLYGSHRDAIRSQIVMLVLMVCFTILGMWLLSAANG